MKKKITFGILAFIIGIGIAFYSESFFRGVIQDIFKWSTSDKIKFIGKNFYVFSNKFYFITFGIGLLILTLENLNQELTQMLKNGILSILIFVIILIGISAVDANMKIIECTACNDGIRKLNWNEINYGMILGTSVIISIIPNLIRIIKRTKKPAYNTV
ncbi:hypothetical protein MHL31_04255 [Lutibacter sp. A80]|uniref:hypothetical protein n=1 Tax=Lutibacter sp. A80 TaxID=2918453 RepID=UPI001F064C1F|nr:hypothetical protein [Lutibacter sp. A80]UMB61421.1 hypothetical protein MHL31_04255 [Lutibacter sp. A80]